ncbi:MAG: bacteriohemerythrin [Dissulfurispiraceae bacterium]|jgi:hemerythrin
MIEWTEDLAVGIETIDSQHRELFAHINSLLGALENKMAAEEIHRLFTFLDSYVDVHFGVEQRYMGEYSNLGYADAEHHKSEHKAFVRDFREFRVDLEAMEPSVQFIAEFARWIVNWWLMHIQRIDKGLGIFLKRVLPKH